MKPGDLRVATRILGSSVNLNTLEGPKSTYYVKKNEVFILLERHNEGVIFFWRMLSWRGIVWSYEVNLTERSIPLV
jgi:hypothetical protein